MALDSEESGSVYLTCVPQGSVLGPIMFLVYMNDLPSELSSQVRLIANDTGVYLSVGGTEDGNVLQKDLDRLSMWEKRWDMKFKPSKVSGGMGDNGQGHNTVYILHCQVLGISTSAKYLGVDISMTYRGTPT